ncbi:maleate cis-trans isomerase family protein [Schaalia vaccimaxillae]|uniref:maleate cis-trans isomerase family protein n=1 Tax=Schaalia vaccimaxillae TaxID=183916 RepID=UPI0003B5C3D5|nr:Asp/Glu racemase [Schaalia vaccimaxillae]
MSTFTPAFHTAQEQGISRIGLIVPSSNTTMETELPELFARQTAATGHRYTFHSARAALKNVTTEELLAMVARAGDCATQVAEAGVDVIAYACLVAVMAQGPGAHVGSEATIKEAAEAAGHPAPAVSSAGAVVRTLEAMGAKKVAMIAPYMPPLVAMTRDYITGSGIEVSQAIGLSVSDNLQVGCLNPNNLVSLSQDLDLDGVDAVLLSACVQMPSLPAVQVVEDALGSVPVITAATATTYETLMALGHEPRISGAGRLLSGQSIESLCTGAEA